VQGGPLSVPTKITRRPDQTPHPPFAGLATEGLHLGLGGLELDRPVEEAVANIMDGFAELHVHPDVPDGLSALAELGIRPVTLSNGSASIAQRLLSSGSRQPLRAVSVRRRSMNLETRIRGVRLRPGRMRCRASRCNAGRRPPLGHRRRLTSRAHLGVDQPDPVSVPQLLPAA
jgi:hypothetical protein